MVPTTHIVERACAHARDLPQGSRNPGLEPHDPTLLPRLPLAQRAGFLENASLARLKLR